MCVYVGALSFDVTFRRNINIVVVNLPVTTRNQYSATLTRRRQRYRRRDHNSCVTKPSEIIIFNFE